MNVGESKKHVESVSEFVDAIAEKVETFKHRSEIWFRGEESEHYNLVPNIYRRNSNGGSYCRNIKNLFYFFEMEQNIDVSFSRKSTPYLSKLNIENTPWNRYFLKQHYGIKTRLLDWTENAFLALFFAITNPAADKNGRVWLLSPFALNDYSVKKITGESKRFEKILICSELERKANLFNEKEELRTSELLRKYYGMDFTSTEEAYPLAIYPPYLDERMSAQQTCFTLYGNIVNGMENNDCKDKLVDYIGINSESKKKILAELRMLGISSFSTFPDMAGLGKTINYDHFRDISTVQDDNELSHIFDQNSEK